MHWTEPSEKETGNAALEKRLWDAADQFRASSGPIFGIIFLRFADVRFTARRAGLKAEYKGPGQTYHHYTDDFRH